MPDPRRHPIRIGSLSLQPADAPERWRVEGTVTKEGGPEATWREWVRFAQRILQVDALSRDLEGRGDAWDEGFAAGRSSGADTPDGPVNPFR